MATILKSGLPPEQQPRPESLSGLAGFNLDDLAEVGIRHLQGVESKAASILSEAKKNAADIKVKAEREGRESGLKAGMVEAEKRIAAEVERQVAERVPRLTEAIQQIADVQTQYLNEVRELLVTTILSATERVVLARLEREPAVIERWAEVALAAVRSASRVTLAVHPETLVQQGEVLERLLTAPGMPEDSHLEPDESIEPAGVVARCDGGAAELTLSGQLQRLDAMLRGEEEEQA